MRGPIAVEPEFRVIDESRDWIVVAKAAPLLVHPSGLKKEPTLLGGLRVLLAYELANGGQLSIINRLDRETSGLVLVAKNRPAAAALGRAFARREVGKEYLALVVGWPERASWRVDAPLRRMGELAESKIWVRQCVDAGGRPAVTGFRVLKRFERGGKRFSLLRCEPETGRMHQIRAHLEYGGHPLVGDKIYGGDGSCYLDFIEGGWTAGLEGRLLLPRHALHASRLTLRIGGVLVTWRCPLPADLRSFVAGQQGGIAKAGSGRIA